MPVLREEKLYLEFAILHNFMQLWDMKGSGVIFKRIATMRDGGSELFEFRGNVYFLDWGILSPTKGVIFHGMNRSGMRANRDLVDKIRPYFPNHEIKCA